MTKSSDAWLDAWVRSLTERNAYYDEKDDVISYFNFMFFKRL